MAKKKLNMSVFKDRLRKCGDDPEKERELFRQYDFSQRVNGDELFARHNPVHVLTDEDVDFASIKSAYGMFRYNPNVEYISLTMPECREIRDMFEQCDNLKYFELHVPSWNKEPYLPFTITNKAEYLVVSEVYYFRGIKLASVKPDNKYQTADKTIFIQWKCSRKWWDEIELIDSLSVTNDMFYPAEWWQTPMSKYRILFPLGRTGLDSAIDYKVTQEFLMDLFVREVEELK